MFQDWSANKGNIKGQLILMCFRLSCVIWKNKTLTVIFFLYLIFYRVFIEWILCVELSWNTTVGSGLRIDHGQALIVNGGTVIGDNCLLRHCTTIGVKKLPDGSYSKNPVIGNNVDVGAGVHIIGPITIGNNVVIGAGSIVIKDVPSNTIVAGNPARVIRVIESKVN